MHKLSAYSCTLVGAVAILSGCGAATNPCDSATDPTVSNGLLASAGVDLTVSTGSLVTLDAEKSSHENGDPIFYSWSIVYSPAGSAARLNSSSRVDPSFFTSKSGDYCMKLTIEDGSAQSEPDYVSVTATTANIAPVANAGSDLSVNESSAIDLDGSASQDANDDGLNYQWRLMSAPPGSVAQLSNASSMVATFVPDALGDYQVELIVNDGALDSAADTLTINYQEGNLAPIANAGADQTVLQAEDTEETTIQLDGSQSTDENGAALDYQWTLISQPKRADVSLNSNNSARPSFTAQVEGSYVWGLTVSDGELNSEIDRVAIYYDDGTDSFIDDFSGSGDIDGVVTNNANALPDVKEVSGRYRANLTNNANDITLHYNFAQGRLDAWQTRFPFEFIARNIGIGSVNNSQSSHPYTNFAFNFAGIQVHSLSLNSPNSAHLVVGHRGEIARQTIEAKNTVNGVSSVNDIGSNRLRNTRADLRVVGDRNGQLRFYWQEPNFNEDKELTDNWIAYDGSGLAPGAQANFGGEGDSVYVGLITYAFGSRGIPFVGTADSIEIIED
ncbi:MAG: PKD domain-containing protein [Pseudomonadales bacterium]|nr:PKD domain-containing protein [Pseudomonadales bacterium]